MANQYSRVFITLKQDRTGYGFKNREPSGRSIIEIRNGFGKLTLMAQDLKPTTVYKAYLVSSTKGGAAVGVGILKVDERGKCEHKWEFDPENVEKTNLSIDYFDVVTVIGPDKTEPTWVLTGFRSTEVRFKDSFHDYKKKETVVEEKTVTEGKAAEVEKAVEEVVVEEKAEKEVVTVEEKTIVGEVVVVEEKAVEEEASVAEEESIAEEESVVEEKSIAEEESIVEEESIDSEEVVAEEEATADKTSADLWPDDEVMDEAPLSPEESENIHENFKTMAQKFNQELAELENYIKMKDKDIEAEKQPIAKSDLERIMEHNVSMSPFKSTEANADLAGIKWVRISTKELAYLPIDYRKYMNDPFICLAYNKYRHLILGEGNKAGHPLGHADGNNGSGKYYIVGVPEIFMREQVQHVERLGFKAFRDCDNIVKMHKSERYGYWLLYV